MFTKIITTKVLIGGMTAGIETGNKKSPPVDEKIKIFTGFAAKFLSDLSSFLRKGGIFNKKESETPYKIKGYRFREIIQVNLG